MLTLPTQKSCYIKYAAMCEPAIHVTGPVKANIGVFEEGKGGFAPPKPCLAP